MARDCKKCVNFRWLHPTDKDAFACAFDPYCSWMEYRQKKVCFNYEEKENK